MDSMIQFYMEETEDLLQKAEECIIELENEYSSVYVNELFRIAHTIKGSSHMAGYKDIGDVMHRIEDMLDCVRNGSILFDQRIVSLCFEGLDVVGRLLQCKKEQVPFEMMQDLINTASGINEMIGAFIRDNKSRSKKDDAGIIAENPATGLISSLLSREPSGRNKFYITFFVEEDAPMISPVFIMILKSIEDIGTLAYSSISDSYFSESSGDHEINTMDIIMCTDIEESELYTYFALPYVEKINITELTRSKLAENDYYFGNSDNTFYIFILGVFVELYNLLFSRSKEHKISKDEFHNLESLYGEAVNAFDGIKNNSRISAFVRDFDDFFSRITQLFNEQSDIDDDTLSDIRTQLTELMDRANNYAKGKHIFKVFKPETNDFVDRLMNFVSMVNKSSTSIIFIDLSNLDILHENEVKALMDVKKQMKEKGIELGIIAGTDARRIVNIFDSIKSIENFKLFGSESDALLGMLYSQNFFRRIIKKASN